MNRVSQLSILFLLGVVGCGGGSDVSASLGLPFTQPSRVTITPALEISAAEAWGERLVIEQISLHLEDVRLLGADPRIPSGGLDLLEAPMLISADGRPEASASLPFPDQFVAGEDLAVFLRVAPSLELDGASVEVYARLYTSAPDSTGVSELSAVDPDVDPARPDEGAVDPDVDPAVQRSTGGQHSDAVDPDVDPARKGEPKEAIDPDVDPARGPQSEDPADPGEAEEGAVDPDVDPAHDSSRSALVQRSPRAPVRVPSIGIVFRDNRAADMVATVGSTARVDMVVGIPVSRWLTPNVVNQLEASLREVQSAALDRSGVQDFRNSFSTPETLIEIRTENVNHDRSLPSSPDGAGDQRCFFLTSGEPVVGNRLGGQ